MGWGGGKRGLQKEVVHCTRTWGAEGLLHREILRGEAQGSGVRQGNPR